MLLLGQLVEAGTYRAVIDRRYPLEQAADAARYVETQQKTGNVVLTINASQSMGRRGFGSTASLVLAVSDLAMVGVEPGGMLPLDHARAEVPVMVSSGDELAAGAGDRSRLRAPDADRDQVAEVLKTAFDAFVQGRLTMDAFVLRVTQVYADLDALTAERHACLRASAADRERVIEVLKVAFVQDRITKNELDQRIGRVLASRACDDLDILTADIPTGLTRAQPAAAARRPDDRKKVIRPASVAFGCTGFVLAVAPALSLGPVIGVVVACGAGVFLAGLIAGLLTFIAWVLDRSSGTQSLQGPPPGAGDGAAEHPAPAGHGGQPRQVGRPWSGAETARSRLPRTPLAGLRSSQRQRPLTTPA